MKVSSFYNSITRIYSLFCRHLPQPRAHQQRTQLISWLCLVTFWNQIKVIAYKSTCRVVVKLTVATTATTTSASSMHKYLACRQYKAPLNIIVFLIIIVSLWKYRSLFFLAHCTLCWVWVGEGDWYDILRSLVLLNCAKGLWAPHYNEQMAPFASQFVASVPYRIVCFKETIQFNLTAVLYIVTSRVTY